MSAKRRYAEVVSGDENPDDCRSWMRAYKQESGRCPEKGHQIKQGIVHGHFISLLRARFSQEIVLGRLIGRPDMQLQNKYTSEKWYS